MSAFPDPEVVRRAAAEAGQDQVFRFWPRLAQAERRALAAQVAAIDFPLVNRLARELVTGPAARKAAPAGRVEPPVVFGMPRTGAERALFREARDRGESLLRAGRVAAFLVAGGQGTRLGFDGPKGCFPIEPAAGRTLFHLFAARIAALGKTYRRPVPLLVMTSEENHDATLRFWADQRYFGLPPWNLSFFRQDMLPAVDDAGKIILESPGRVHTSPNGHGGSLSALAKSGALADLMRGGFEELFYFQVDNPLAEVCDPLFIGMHALAGADMSTKVVKKTDPAERVGALARMDTVPTVIEYSELGEDRSRLRAPDGSLLYCAGNAAIHMLRVEFVHRVTSDPAFALPYHVAKKQCPAVNDLDPAAPPLATAGYKFEMFVFDALRHARATTALEIDRAEEFAPVKNATGVDSPATARAALAARERRRAAAAVAAAGAASGAPAGPA